MDVTFIFSFPDDVLAQHILLKILYDVPLKYCNTWPPSSWIEIQKEIDKWFHLDIFESRKH